MADTRTSCGRQSAALLDLRASAWSPLEAPGRDWRASGEAAVVDFLCASAGGPLYYVA